MAVHLSALDATFLELEQADPNAHMHIGSVLVFEPVPEGGAPLLEELILRLDERLEAMPRYRQRLSSRTVAGLRRPAWVDDDRFDVAAHVRRAALPEPGGEAELLDWAAEFFSHRLDRDRPLWEMVLLEGLAGGHWALASKTHHCMVDGVGSVGVTEALLDATPEPGPERPAVPSTADPGTLRALAAAPWHLARAGLDVAAHPGAALARTRNVVELIVRDELRAAPQTSINAPLGKTRRLATLDVTLDELRDVKRALGGTVNDVILAMVTGGLRRLLEERGERLPRRPLRAMVPVNVRAGDDRMALGNKVTSLFVPLPVGIDDRAERLAAIREATEALKHNGQAGAGSDLVELSALAPPLLHAAIGRASFGTRLFNITVTNVPGPPATLYAFGAPMVRVVPLVPLAAEHTVGVAIVSYAGRLCFCVNADREAVPDAETLTAGMRDELAALRDLATASA